MRHVHTFQVIPTLPEEISVLRDIALDLHWTWNPDAIDLFHRLDPGLWREVNHNPIRLLAEIPQERLAAMAHDEAFLGHLNRVWDDFENYRSERSWFQGENGDSDMKVAYLSMEFGLHEALPIYSGGLGVLAGDHLKAASDLGIPLVGIGLFYQRGYFRQYLNVDGWQQEMYPDYDPFSLPLEQVTGKDGPLSFSINIGTRDVRIQVWKVKVGRVDLYLLDTNLPENHPDDRRITETLYGGDSEMRIRQEILLGIGGITMLSEMGIAATVYHMNEGHSAFLALERIRRLMNREKMTFHEAQVATRSANIFTTHTPVPAGIDRFSIELVTKYFKDYWTQIGLDRKGFLALGGANEEAPESSFNMAAMAIRLSAYTNGVSEIHGKVSRRMWHELWPGVSEDETPIGHVTNGIHARSWVAPEIGHLFDRYIGPMWQENPQDTEIWKRVRKISTEELWRTRQRQRESLVTFTRERLAEQLKRRGESPEAVERAQDVLDMEALTIGFARRFATYKRANLLFRDPERLIRILTNPEKPVQIILAGKAHPRDEPGKKIIRDLIHFARDERIRKNVVFLEDYDMNVARHMVRGTDVWLNTPRVPMEASGTSGMKAAINGVLHCSTPDGWWAEAYEPGIGWSIGTGEVYEDEEVQNKIESELLYDLLEKQIVPLFYRRDQGKVGREWTETIKAMLEKVSPFFITTRMVGEYTRKAYKPCHHHAARLKEAQYKPARELSTWQERIRSAWSKVEIDSVESDVQPAQKVGDELNVTARVRLGDLAPEDVRVEVVRGRVGADQGIHDPRRIPMERKEADGDLLVYSTRLTCEQAGKNGFYVRVLPRHDDQMNELELGYVTHE